MSKPPPAANLEWTVLKVLQWAAPYLKERGIDSPRATAEILLGHVLHTERVQLYMHHDQPLEPVELAAFNGLLRRRLGREPVAIKERRLFALMTIGGVLTAVFGLWLLILNPGLLATGWLQLKLGLVVLLIGYHAWNWRLVLDFAAGRNAHSDRWYRWFNEAPSILLIGIVLLAVARPF